MIYVIYQNCSTFQKTHVGQYSKGNHVFKVENFHLFITVFSFFLLFTI